MSNALREDPVFTPVVYSSLEEAEAEHRRWRKLYPEFDLPPSKQLLELRAAAHRNQGRPAD